MAHQKEAVIRSISERN